MRCRLRHSVAMGAQAPWGNGVVCRVLSLLPSIFSPPSCPLSSSLMYSFAQRSDTQVLDEPLYASYLKLTGMPRPYREQVGLR